jgi:hypothetical protein
MTSSCRVKVRLAEVDTAWHSRKNVMNTIKGTWTNGQVVLREAADWPEGTQVIVEPVLPQRALCIPEDEWPADPEGIARHLDLMDRIEPLEMTADEVAEWKAARQAIKAYTLTNMHKDVEGLFP